SFHPRWSDAHRPDPTMQKLIFLVALCAALASCGGGSSAVDTGSTSGDPQNACSIAAQRTAVTAWMQDQYYWYPQLRTPDANAAGLRRGDTILSVDGFTPAEVIAGAAARVTVEGVPRTIQTVDAYGNVKTLDMVSANFSLTPVRDVAVLDATRNGQPVKVGY